MSKVEWRPVPDYEGSYEVSESGHVRSLTRCAGRRVIRGQTITGRPDRDGYPTVGLWREGLAVRRRVHQIVLSAFVGPCPHGQEALHRDGDPTNPDLSNLRWGTKSENAQDSIRHGTNARARRKHCPLGHQLVAPNLLSANARRGWRSCRACSQARQSSSPDFRTTADQSYTRIMAGESGPVSGRTHCPRGHRLAAPNLVASQIARGWRECKSCNEARRHSDLDFQTESDRRYREIMSGNATTSPARERTHCPRGHRLVEPNLAAAQLAKGKRECRSCHQARHHPHLGLQAESDRRYDLIMPGAPAVASRRRQGQTPSQRAARTGIRAGTPLSRDEPAPDSATSAAPTGGV